MVILFSSGMEPNLSHPNPSPVTLEKHLGQPVAASRRGGRNLEILAMYGGVSFRRTRAGLSPYSFLCTVNP